ncbi:dihydrolipoamide acetyltransferase component of pyruvate dehydrogenase complex [Actinomycetes bacterium]|nr:dihydrolipoamide acetyltransferase component of pyruvate dehydrogenase complex [Actinomycetes bacterium]
MADITLPQLGETVTEGTITRWFKKVGDAVAADEPLFEVSTDKVDTEVPSPISGTLTEIRVKEGDTVAVGTVIAVVGAANASPAAPVVAPAAPVVAPAAPAAPVAKPAPAPAPVVAASVATATRTPMPTSTSNKLLSPVVRRLVADHGIDVNSLVGTGPGGRITREDVLDFIDKNGSAPKVAAPAVPAVPAVPAAPAVPAVPAAQSAPAAAVAPPAKFTQSSERETVTPLSKIRKLTGAHMIMSQKVSPHAFSVVEVDYANVDTTRNAVKDQWKQSEGFTLTYLPFIARAIVDALAEFPNLNASIEGENLIVHNYVDLGVAVDLQFQGLLVPVVRSADSKRLRAIAREIFDLATRARSRKLTPDEIQGGTFTISNNGSAGSVLTMPIINQPQVAILSTDAIVRKPVVAQLSDGSESIAIHPVGNLAMSWDHRAFDGAYAAGFLAKLKQVLETQDWSAEI